MARIIETLPDPDDASRRMADFMLNQIMKRIREANEKFEAYGRNAGDAGELRVVVVADNTSIRASTALDEHFIGRKMGAYDEREDQTGLVDSIILVKSPAFVIDEPNSYWFKCLRKRWVAGQNRDLAHQLAGALHHRISHYAEYFPAISQVRHGRFRILNA
jgi:hypothetical protein